MQVISLQGNARSFPDMVFSRWKSNTRKKLKKFAIHKCKSTEKYFQNEQRNTVGSNETS
jgi:hypothetical protein